MIAYPEFLHQPPAKLSAAIALALINAPADTRDALLATVEPITRAAIHAWLNRADRTRVRS